MKKLIFYSLFSSLFGFYGCDNYLDIEPKGMVIASTTEDYDLLLNGGGQSLNSLYIETELIYSADDFNFVEAFTGDISDPNNTNFHLLSFSDKRFANPNQVVAAWNDPYANIYVYNKVINEVNDATVSPGYSESDKNRIKAEALFGRAQNYWVLANLFAPAYDTANADKKVIPIVTKADVTQKSVPQATLGEVYSFIINDLENSLEFLTDKQQNAIRPDKAAAYALLSRVYLFKGDYAKANEYAQNALAIKSSLLDYIAMKADPSIDAETELAKEQYTYLYYGYQRGSYGDAISSDLIGLFDTDNDARLAVFSNFFQLERTDNAGNPVLDHLGNPILDDYYMLGKVNSNLSVSIPEMYLTLAETSARLGDNATAINKMNELLANRIENYTDKTATDFTSDDELLKFILEERRKEMYPNLIRLFEIKRLNLDSRFAVSVKHTIKGKTYEATPNSGKLVFPIPAQVRKFNPSYSN